MMQQMVLSIVAIIVGVILLTATATTVNTNTATNAFNSSGTDNPAGQLENVSSTAQTIYGLYDFIYALLGLGLIIGGFVVFFTSAGIIGGKNR